MVRENKGGRGRGVRASLDSLLLLSERHAFLLSTRVIVLSSMPCTMSSERKVAGEIKM